MTAMIINRCREVLKRYSRIENFTERIFLQHSEENIEKLENWHRKDTARDLLHNLKKTYFKKKKIGNLYFIKKEEFIIVTTGSITTYIGFSKDGTLVAIHCARKNPENMAYFTNEINCVKNPKTESKNIIKYVSLEEDKKHIFLAVQLWDFDLDEYIKNLTEPEVDHNANQTDAKTNKDQQNILRKIVKEMLLGLQVLHQAGVIHRDLHPRHIVMDFEENVRLRGFGRNLKLEDRETTNQATGQENDYTKSVDIKAAGELVFYILTRGKHPFGCEITNDMMEDVGDTVAQALIKWMIDNKPDIDEVLKHPYFWNKKRKEEAIRKLGDLPEVQYYTSILNVCKQKKDDEGLTAVEAVEKALSNKKDKSRKSAILGMLGETEEFQNEKLEYFSNLCDFVVIYTQGKSFNKWKSELSDKWPDIDQSLPEDLLGLLRVFRNKLIHGGFDDQMFDRFQDFYINLHKLAKSMSWEWTWS